MNKVSKPLIFIAILAGLLVLVKMLMSYSDFKSKNNIEGSFGHNKVLNRADVKQKKPYLNTEGNQEKNTSVVRKTVVAKTIEQQEIQVLAMSIADKKAVLRLSNGDLRMVSVGEKIDDIGFFVVQIATDRLMLKDIQTNELVWLTQVEPRQAAKVTRFTLKNLPKSDNGLTAVQPITITKTTSQP